MANQSSSYPILCASFNQDARYTKPPLKKWILIIIRTFKSVALFLVPNSIISLSIWEISELRDFFSRKIGFSWKENQILWKQQTENCDVGKNDNLNLFSPNLQLLCDRHKWRVQSVWFEYREALLRARRVFWAKLLNFSSFALQFVFCYIS